MAGENVAQRPIAKDALVYLKPVTTQLNGCTLTRTAPATLAASANNFGPATDISIRDPRAEITQTASGDVGAHVVHGRKDVWEITISAFMDLCEEDEGALGDANLASLLGNYVEVLIARSVGIYVCTAFGRFNLDTFGLPVAAGDSITRNIRISRWVGSAIGDILWADQEDGTFPP